MSSQFKIAIFIILSVGFGWLTRRSLADFRSHGFYRFFAFESILTLILLNLGFWFHEPFSLNQIASWTLLTISAYLAVQGLGLLRKFGKVEESRSDRPLLGFEKTTELVTEGVYRYLRHPMYGSLLFLAWGAFFKNMIWASAGLALMATIFLTITARVEEAENLQYFGPDYRSYMNRSRMFIPYLW